MPPATSTSTPPGAATVEAGLPQAHLPRLAVASRRGVSMWDEADKLAADRSPEVTITREGLDVGATAVAVDGDRLFAARDVSGGDVAIVAFDGARTLDAAKNAVAVIRRPARPINRFVVDAKDRLWVSDGGSYALFEHAKTLKSDAPPTLDSPPLVSARPAPAFAIEPLSSNLFFGFVQPAAGIWLWTEATYLRETSDVFPELFHDGGYGAMVLEKDRLYAAGDHGGVAKPGMSGSLDGTKGIAIWDAVSSLDKPTEPTVTMRAGYGASSVLVDVVVRDDVLVVATQGDDKVMIYEGASRIVADRPPDFVLTHPQLVHPSRLVIGGDARLYVLDQDGVVVFENIKTHPTFVAKLTAGLVSPKGLTLLE